MRAVALAAASAELMISEIALWAFLRTAYVIILPHLFIPLACHPNRPSGTELYARSDALGSTMWRLWILVKPLEAYASFMLYFAHGRCEAD